MLSIRQILFTAAVVAAVWLAYRWLDRAKRERAGRPPARRKTGGTQGNIEDLVACPRCGDFTAVGAAACDRADCPRR